MEIIGAWIAAILIAIVIVTVSTANARRKAEAWNRDHVPKLEAMVAALVDTYGSMRLCIEALGDLRLLVSEAHLHLVAEDTAVVHHTIAIDSITRVTVHNESAHHISFTVENTGGYAFRTLRVSSLADFADLFNVFVDFGKPVRFSR